MKSTMKKIITDDGTITFYNKQAQETYHSTSGALEEAQKKFAEPCKVKEGDLVLDICFGLGYNAAAALSRKASVVALENDETLKEVIKNLELPLESYVIVKKVVAGEEDARLKIFWGDARKTIKALSQKFDACFLDPFSPKKQPELWTLDFFKDIRKVLKPGAVLATYSCARVVRDNLKKAGFQVKDGPVVGRKSPGTIAINLVTAFPMFSSRRKHL
ncbi:MAG: MnmC family methyltransferase [archaeon]